MDLSYDRLRTQLLVPICVTTNPTQTLVAVYETSGVLIAEDYPYESAIVKKYVRTCTFYLRPLFVGKEVRQGAMEL